MPPLSEPLLQPLRIPTGWHVAYNQFFDVDPDLSVEAYSGVWWDFKEDMLQLTHSHYRVLVDLGWYPEHQPEGSFKLVLIQLTDDKEDMPEAWSHPIATYRSQSRQTIVATIEAWLHDPLSRKKVVL